VIDLCRVTSCVIMMLQQLVLDGLELHKQAKNLLWKTTHSSRNSNFSKFAVPHVVCSEIVNTPYCNSPTESDKLPEVYWACTCLNISGSFQISWNSRLLYEPCEVLVTRSRQQVTKFNNATADSVCWNQCLSLDFYSCHWHDH